MSNVPLLLQADSYKYSHFKLFPKGTINNNSYIESRGVDRDSMLPQDAEIVFFGLQAFIKEYLSKPITAEDVDRADKLITAHGLPFNYEDWMKIVTNYNGYLPIEIQAIPEGSIIGPGVAMVQVRATDESFAWLASFVETAILRAVWYPTTVATVSREAKKIIWKYLEDTSDNPEAEIPFKLHDFGARGVSSSESAKLGGMAHLVNFMGTDTVEALIGAQDYYGVEGAAGFSIPASEHSTMTSWGKEHEIDAFKNMLDVYAGKTPLIACVSDSYDIFNAVTNLWPSLKDQIVESGTTLVVRPDSGDPVITPTTVVRLLDRNFGSSENSKGYKVLDNVRVIQGDGINLNSITEILRILKKHGYAADNIAFGMGGALLQKVDRDTLKFAMKTNAVQIEGEGWRDVYKSPIGSSFKKSKAGILGTWKNENGKFRTDRISKFNPYIKNYLEVVFREGKLLKETTFEEVRKNAEVK